jgi:hypothetical protein
MMQVSWHAESLPLKLRAEHDEAAVDGHELPGHEM